MTDRLDGTVALVTGASSGIGEAAAIELAAQGAAVALAARRTGRLTELAAKIRADGGTAMVFTADVTLEEDARALVEPGATSTELASHNRPEIRERMGQRFAGVERLEAADIAETIAFIVTRPRRMAVNEVLVRPTEQEG